MAAMSRNNLFVNQGNHTYTWTCEARWTKMCTQLVRLLGVAKYTATY